MGRRSPGSDLAIAQTACRHGVYGVDEPRVFNHGEFEMTTNPSPADVQALLPELAQLVVSAVNLDVDPASIDPDEPLYRDGLGLDSIDILEIALVVSRQYGAQIKAGDADNAKIFGSLRTLAQYIVAHRQAT